MKKASYVIAISVSFFMFARYNGNRLPDAGLFYENDASAVKSADAILPGYRPLGRINFLDISDADNTGRTDNSPAIISAISALPPEGGIIYFPPGRYKISSTLVIIKSNVTLEGAGIDATQLVGDRLLPVVIQEGSVKSRVYNNGLESLTIGRSDGVPPVESVGIFWASFNYGWERRVLSTDHFYDRRWDDLQYPSDISIGYDASQIYAKNAVQSYGWVAEVADLRISSAEFGRNKGERYSPECGIKMSGVANNINFEQTWLIPRGPERSKGAMVCFTDIPKSSSGIYRFINSYGENWNYGVEVKISAPEVKELSFVGGHFSSRINLFDQALGISHLLQLSIENSNFTGNISIDSASYSRFVGNDVGGIFGVGSHPDFRASLSIIGNTFSHGVNLTGSWSKLVFSGNIMHEDGSFSDSAVGDKFISGNVGGFITNSVRPPP